MFHKIRSSLENRRLEAELMQPENQEIMNGLIEQGHPLVLLQYCYPELDEDGRVEAPVQEGSVRVVWVVMQGPIFLYAVIKEKSMNGTATNSHYGCCI